MVCPKCGKITERSYNGLCQGCYKYFRSGGKVYPLPEAGKVEHDESGKVICHICGRSYNRLGSHIRESHSMTIEEYKAEFGLCSCTRTTEKSYSQTMRENAYKYDMDKRLLEAGKSTRIKKGETDKRKNKKVRLQEILEKRNRGEIVTISQPNKRIRKLKTYPWAVKIQRSFCGTLKEDTLENLKEFGEVIFV